MEENRVSFDGAVGGPSSSINVTGLGNVAAGRDVHNTINFNNNTPAKREQKNSKPFRLIDAPTLNFVGREDLIQKIHSLLTSCSTKTHWQERIVIIHGLGGMGKSELARKYVQLHLNDSIIQNVAWIDSESKASLEKSFNRIAREFEIKTKKLDIEEIAECVYRYFSNNFDAGLFVFDNVEQLRDQKPYFGIIKYLPTILQNKLPLILITSRINEWEAPKGQHNTICISELGEDQAVQLLITKLNLDEDQKKDTHIQTAVKNLAKVIQGYPLGLTLAASNIDSSKFVNVAQEIEKYIVRLNVPNSGWIDDEHSAGFASKYTLVMSNVWQATFDRIKTMKVGGECALTLLHIIAFLPTDDIMKSSVDEILKFGYPSLEDHKVKGYIHLEKFSLISLRENKDWDEEKYFVISVHRHVQRCTRERLDAVGDYSYLLNVGRFLCQKQVNRFDAEESAQTIHRHLKQRKWPNNSIQLSIILLSRYWDNDYYSFAFELATDLSEAIEADVQAYAHSLKSGYQTLLGLSLHVFFERPLRKNDAIATLQRQWNKKHREAFDASVKIFTCSLTLTVSVRALEVCTEVQQRIADVMEYTLVRKYNYKVSQISLQYIGAEAQKIRQLEGNTKGTVIALFTI